MFIIQLTDGTKTIDFMGSAARVEDGGLQISPPEASDTWSDPTLEGGASLVNSRFGNRTITLLLSLSGATRTEIRNTVNDINYILSEARLHSLGNSPTRVTFKYAWDTVDEVDHFEIIKGTFTLPDDVLSVEKMLSKVGTKYTISGCTLEMIANPNVYGLSPSTDSLIELPLTNRNGTNVLGGIKIADWTDTSTSTKSPANIYYDNYVEIAGSNIQGDAPAKVMLTVQDISGSMGGYDTAWIGAHEKISAPLFFHWSHSQMEMMVGGRGYTEEGAFKKSYFRSVTLAEDMGGILFNLKLVNPALYGSKKYRVFMFSGSGMNHYYPPTTYTASLYTTNDYNTRIPIYIGPNVTPKYSAYGRTTILDLGVIQLPPYSPKQPAPKDMYLTVENVVGAGYPWYFNLNYLWLLPVEGGYRKILFPGDYSDITGQGSTLVDDGWSELTYMQEPSGKTIGGFNGQFAPITLTPGKTQRIYFNMYGHHGIFGSSDSYIVRAYYSPARNGAV